MQSKITATHPTLLKKEPVQGSDLDPKQKVEVPEGTSYNIVWKGEEERGHTKVSLSWNGGDWYIYPPHWTDSGFDNILPVRYFSQRDNYRDANRTCFSSTCAMLVEYLKPGTLPGKYGDDLYIKRVFHYGDTTVAQTQLNALESFEVKARFVQNGSISLLKNQIDAGKPVPVGILHHGPASAPSGGGHWLLVVGYTSTGFTVHDPYGSLDHSSGTYISEDGDSRHYSYDLFKARWTVSNDSDGWAIIV